MYMYISAYITTDKEGKKMFRFLSFSVSVDILG